MVWRIVILRRFSMIVRVIRSDGLKSNTCPDTGIARDDTVIVGIVLNSVIVGILAASTAGGNGTSASDKPAAKVWSAVVPIAESPPGGNRNNTPRP
jgi:hypothetical protein